MTLRWKCYLFREKLGDEQGVYSSSNLFYICEPTFDQQNITSSHSESQIRFLHFCFEKSCNYTSRQERPIKVRMWKLLKLLLKTIADERLWPRRLQKHIKGAERNWCHPFLWWFRGNRAWKTWISPQTTVILRGVLGEAIYCSWQFSLGLHNLPAQWSHMKYMGRESLASTFPSSLIFRFCGRPRFTHTVPTLSQATDKTDCLSTVSSTHCRV